MQRWALMAAVSCCRALIMASLICPSMSTLYPGHVTGTLNRIYLLNQLATEDIMRGLLSFEEPAGAATRQLAGEDTGADL